MLITHSYTMYLYIFMIALTGKAHGKGQTELVFDELSDAPYHQELKTLIESAYARLNIKLRYERHPLLRSYAEVNLGRLSGLMARVSRNHLKNNGLIKVEKPIARFRLALVVNQTLCFKCVLTDTKSLGVVSGYATYAQYAQQHDIHHTLVEVANRQTLFEMMSRGRLDAMLVSDVLLPDALLKQHGDWKVTYLSDVYLFHYLRRQYAYLMPELNTAFEAAKAEQENSLMSAAVPR